MKVEIFKSCPQKEAIVVFYDDSKKALTKWSDPVIRDYLKLPLEKDFNGQFKESLMVYLPGHPIAKRLLVMGSGKASQLTEQKLRQLAAEAVSQLQKRQVYKGAAFLVPKLPKISSAAAAEALIIGGRVFAYHFDEWKSSKPKKTLSELDCIVLDAKDKKPVQQALERAETIADGVNFGRRLIAMSPLQLYPEELARIAVDTCKKSVSRSKIKTQVWTEKDLKKHKYGGILGVGQGSDRGPTLIQLEYNNAAKSKKPIVLVGKGITFDSGGLSLKPPAGQETMKYDMAGAGTVLAAFKIATDLQLKINLVCLIPAAENMPSAKAQRPGDVITMASGTTVEVLNTDAEGRLVLADALTHATRKYKSEAIIDVATLTGACALAVGDAAAGMFGNNPKLMTKIQKAADASGENVWPLPDFDEFYAELLQSEVADLRNIGKRREGGATTAALFLKHFVENDQAWIHLDIAGCGWYDAPRDFIGIRGPSGVPIRMLVEFLRSHA